MRLTEYMHWLSRTDIGMAVNPKKDDYYHITIRQEDKRARYLYQCNLKGKEPVIRLKSSHSDYQIDIILVMLVRWRSG